MLYTHSNVEFLNNMSLMSGVIIQYDMPESVWIGFFTMGHAVKSVSYDNLLTSNSRNIDGVIRIWISILNHILEIKCDNIGCR